jgi:metal-responsive CopG/Arc/MetJ family transcriptional regulator
MRVEYEEPPVRRGKTILRPEVIHIRMSTAGLAAIDAMAEREDRNRSDMIRILLQRGMEASR